VVALVVRQVTLQQVEVLVDVPDQPGPLCQEVDGPDAAGSDAPDLLGDLEADVGGGHHRLGALDAGLVLQAAEDLPLASGELAMNNGVHSKTPGIEGMESMTHHCLFSGIKGFFESSDPDRPGAILD
jgi:hypothetical protein